MGGLGGHIEHLYDDANLTFGELKRILTDAALGKTTAYEKVDGQNIYVGIDSYTGEIKCARNRSNLKSGGMNLVQLAKMFDGRPLIQETFMEGFNAIRTGLNSLTVEELSAVFGDDGEIWLSFEILYKKNPNTLNYDKNLIVAHRFGGFIVGDEIFDITDSIARTSLAMLNKVSPQINDSLQAIGWEFAGPPRVNLSKIPDVNDVLAPVIELINDAMLSGNVHDSNTIGDYLVNRLMNEKMGNLPVYGEKRRQVALKAASIGRTEHLNLLTAGMSTSQKSEIKRFLADADKLVAEIMHPIIMAVTVVGAEVIESIDSAIVEDPRETSLKLQKSLRGAITMIKNSGNKDAEEFLRIQLRKINKRLDEIYCPVEGIVFKHGDNIYKMTGYFAPINQIIGLCRYGRGSIVINPKQ